MTPPRWLRQRRWQILVGTVALLMAGGGYLVWRQRWHISKRAIGMADGSVRQWATEEVARLSHGAYRLRASTIHVDEAQQRISIDSIVLTTDTAAAVGGPRPLPILNLLFHACALQGIQLTRLAAGGGLHASRLGCDSVTLVADLGALHTAGDSAASSDSTTFLALTKDLKLPRQIGTVSIDTVSFPTVSLDLAMERARGRSTRVTLDRLSMRLDSLHYDPDEPRAERRTLLSRSALVTLDHFDGRQAQASRLELAHLALDLSRRTISLDSLAFEPLPGRRTDSLGFTALTLQHLRVSRMDWHRLLTGGDLRMGMVRLDTAVVTYLPDRVTAGRGLAYPPLTLETSLRAIDRVVFLDTLIGTDVRAVAARGRRSTGAVTSAASITLTGMRVTPDDSAWAGAFPLGRITLLAEGISRVVGTDRLDLAHLAVDVPAQRIAARGFRSGPTGSDADFLRRSPFAHDRVEFAADSLRMLGADFREFVRHDRYVVRRLELHGGSVDILVDHGLPSDTTRRHPHRTPQAVVRALPISLRIDTAVVRGRITLREREADAPSPGVLVFEPVQATLTNVTNDPQRMSDSTPLRVIIDSRLMRSAPVHVEATMPLLAPDFRMQWHAQVGAMPMEALNPFIMNATGMKFTDGTMHQVAIRVVVRGGRARGTIQPRWEGLHVEFPGIARSDRGLLGGIRRGLAKLAANAFAVRDDNVTQPGHPALDGRIDHQWTRAEALPAFIWNSLQEALLPLLKH